MDGEDFEFEGLLVTKALVLSLHGFDFVVVRVIAPIKTYGSMKKRVGNNIFVNLMFSNFKDGFLVMFCLPSLRAVFAKQSRMLGVARLLRL